jgi:quercetin dioxygenase-like cupin family protein
MQYVIGKELSKSFNITQVNFGRSVRNKFHSHSKEQVLIVTEGKGIVATDDGEITVAPRCYLYSGGEKHWHGPLKVPRFHTYMFPPDTERYNLKTRIYFETSIVIHRYIQSIDNVCQHVKRLFTKIPLIPMLVLSQIDYYRARHKTVSLAIVYGCLVDISPSFITRIISALRIVITDAL